MFLYIKPGSSEGDGYLPGFMLPGTILEQAHTGSPRVL